MGPAADTPDRTSPNGVVSQSISVTAPKTWCSLVPPKQLAGIRHDDDAVDDLCRHLFTLMDQLWKHGVHADVNVTLLGRFYERFADHAVEICRRMLCHVTREPRTA